MRSRRFDPRHLDVEAFARDGASLDGAWSVGSLTRLAEMAHQDAPPAPDATAGWEVRGERRNKRREEPETWLTVKAHAPIVLVCQRCLGTLPFEIDVDRAFRFVRDETAAAELDAEVEDDVLAMTRALDIRELIEDELLLALPIVPTHSVCPEPLDALLHSEAPIDGETERPFAALAALKASSGKP